MRVECWRKAFINHKRTASPGRIHIHSSSFPSFVFARRRCCLCQQFSILSVSQRRSVLFIHPSSLPFLSLKTSKTRRQLQFPPRVNREMQIWITQKIILHPGLPYRKYLKLPEEILSICRQIWKNKNRKHYLPCINFVNGCVYVTINTFACC